MNQFYDRMNILNPSKYKIVEFILENDFDLVLDLGAGSCVIEQSLLRHKFKGDIIAIEQNPVTTIKSSRKCKIIQDDIIYGTYCMLKPINKHKNVCIVLSAILHELSERTLHELETLINLIKGKVTLYIREPLITDQLIAYDCDGVGVVVDDDYLVYKGLHKGQWSEEVTFINYCFLKSYGVDSWGREKKEGRFTFTGDEVAHFVSECWCIVEDVQFEKDSFYRKTLPYGLYEKLNYTGSTVIARKVGK